MRQEKCEMSLVALSRASLVLSVVLVGLLSCTRSTREGELLATIPEVLSEPEKGWHVAFSHDLSKVAYRAQRGGKMFVVDRDREGESFDKVSYPQFSPDGSKLAYIAEQGGKVFMVVNEQRGLPFEDVGYATFSPNSKRVAYRAKDIKFGAAFLRVVVDEKLIGGEFFMVDQPLFTPDSIEVVYVATKGPDFREGRLMMGAITLYIGERPVTAHEGLQDPAFSPDGKRLAYVKIEGLYSGMSPRYSVVIDQEEGPSFDEAREPVFSPDGKSIAYLARHASKWFTVVAGLQGPQFDDVANPVFAPGAGQLAYAAKNGKKWAIVVGKTAGPAFDDVGKPVFSLDGAKFAYRAKVGQKWCVVVGTEQSMDCDEVSDPVFAADGRTVQ